MDPNTTLTRIAQLLGAQALTLEDITKLGTLAGDLERWLGNGGTMPRNLPERHRPTLRIGLSAFALLGLE